MPQFISRSEAKSQGLPKYYDGARCRKHSHDCERYTSNGACVECVLSSQSGAITRVEKEMNRNRMKRPVTKRSILSGEEMALALDAFAKAGSLEAAASALGLTPHQLTARRTANENFDASLRKLEERFSSGSLTAASTPGFVWTDENRAQLIERYVDTGDIGEARDCVGVSPSAYHRELSSNEAFAQAVADATPLAKQHLKERAIQLSLKGNDRLLQIVLKADFPEYRDSLKLDVNTTVRQISDSDLERKLANKLKRLAVIDAEYSVVEPRREIGTAEATGGEGTPNSAQ